jgi:hypothetical protein
VYEQIARNKRRTLGYIGLFVSVWLGIGALLGGLAAVSGAQPGSSASVVPDVAAGVVLAGLLAMAGVAFTLMSGTNRRARRHGERSVGLTDHR